MLVPPVTSVDRPGGSLRLEARSTHQLDPPQKSSVPGCSGILDRSLETSPWGSSSPHTAHTLPDYGCVWPWVGRYVWRLWTPHDQWCLDARADSSPYQLFGDVSSLPRLEEILEYAVWPACLSSDRQHNSDVLPEQGRRDQVQESEPIGSRSDTPVHRSADFFHGSPSCRGRQCRGRSPLMPQSGESMQDRSFYRVVSDS